MSSSDGDPTGLGQKSEGINLKAFGSALVVAVIIFAVQITIFQLLRDKLARIYKPKTFMVPEKERIESPPASPWSLVLRLLRFPERTIIEKCGLDAYFFLRYMQMLLVIFIPVALVAIPILVPLNYIDGLGQDIVESVNSTNTNSSNKALFQNSKKIPTGLDTLAWGNMAPRNHHRRWAHFVVAVCIVFWVCFVCFLELRVYIKVRQDYLTSPAHRLRASANTVLVNSIPEKWVTEEALRGLFDVFPGGIRNIWITRDYTELLSKVHKRDAIRDQLEAAQSDLIRDAKRAQMKQRAANERRERRPTKAEIHERDRIEDEEAQRRAEAGRGLSVGNHEHVPRVGDLDGGEGQSVHSSDGSVHGGDLDDKEMGRRRNASHVLGRAGQGFGQGLKGGARAVGRAGQGIRRGVDGSLSLSRGLDITSPRPQIRDGASPRERALRTAPESTPGAVDPRQAVAGNTTRKLTNLDSLYAQGVTRWWQFWKAPNGGFASPVPQGSEGDGFSDKGQRDKNADKMPPTTVWGRIKAFIPFVHGEKTGALEYTLPPSAFVYKPEDDEGAEWTKYLDKSKRPTHFRPLFGWTPSWLPTIPWFGRKVDTIYWCRAELARLNMEIEEDQQHPGRYPALKSAFIQFNSQVAAHMACQSITHHVPRIMAPRMIEIAPKDVIWDNMAIGWLSEWLRTAAAVAVVGGMVGLWAVPVAFTSSLSQIDSLVEKYQWLAWLRADQGLYNFASIIAGVLPAAMLGLLLFLVPVIFHFLAEFQGAKTTAVKAESVQIYYFGFLFVQVFLVVSIASGAITTLTGAISNLSSVPEVLAQNLPRAANYFFSYMILQALSNSTGTLLQIGTLFSWFVLARIMDNTARAKWARQVLLPTVTWGSFFPVYTNFACIALIYSVIAPIISIFAMITFSLLWMAHRYQMLYVTRFQTDTGGVLFPRAINQLFTGLYVMELCLAGLFFLSQDENKVLDGWYQGVGCLILLFMTVLYQFVLNMSFGPFFRYLPITLEDEAVLRDEIFQRDLDRRMGITEEHEGSEAASLNPRSGPNSAHGPARSSTDDIEMRKLSGLGRTDTGGSTSSLMNGFVQVQKTSRVKQLRGATFGRAERNIQKAANYRKGQRQKDLEAQRAMGEALYGGYHNVIEDLTPEERDDLVRKAFEHEALRSRRPAIWIPQDDIGVSDDEVRRTHNFSKHLWISNQGTGLDSKVRVVFGMAPPDFSEVDIITL